VVSFLRVRLPADGMPDSALLNRIFAEAMPVGPSRRPSRSSGSAASNDPPRAR